MTKWRKELKRLRRELVAIYMQPTFDVDKAGAITDRIREALGAMAELKPEIIQRVRQCFNADIGLREAARRLKLSPGFIQYYYNKFHQECSQPAKIGFGDPEPGRSALEKIKTAAHQIPDLAPVIARTIETPPAPVKVTKTYRTRNNGPMPTADQVGWTIVQASKCFGCDPILAASGHGLGRRGSQGIEFSRARMYAVMALQKAFPTTARPALARLVGLRHGSALAFIPNIEFRMKRGELKWWDSSVVDRIAAGIAQR